MEKLCVKEPEREIIIELLGGDWLKTPNLLKWEK